MDNTNENQNIYEPFKPPFKYDEMGGYVVDSNNNIIVDIRGWGYLTGTSGLNYTPQKATEIQDKIGERIAKLISIDAKV